MSAGAPAADLPPAGAPTPAPPKRARWKAVVLLAGLVGLGIAAVTTVDDARGAAMPAPLALIAAFVLYLAAMVCAAQGWVALFPPGADRRALRSGLYTSQLTKYLPAGGFVQAASQVALSNQSGLAFAALRLPVFSLCSVVAGATLGSGVALEGDLPAWGRVVAAFGVLSLLALHRDVLAFVLRLARRVVRRLPDPENLPPQGAILRCYAFAVGNIGLFGAAFVILLGDLADIEPLPAGAALAAGWALGYLVIFIPSGLFVREAVLVAALPGLAAGTLLAASIAHRLVGVAAEAVLAGTAYARLARARRRVPATATTTAAPIAPSTDDAGVAFPVDT